jgi:hypothetical protein
VPLFDVAVTLVVVGVLLWLVTTHIPMNPKVKQVLVALVVVVLVLWILSLFGILDSVRSVQVPRVR